LRPIATDGAEQNGAAQASFLSPNEETQDDPDRNDFDEALEQIVTQRWCVCPLCGAIVAPDGTVVG
jgi:hypothetical protein